MSTNKGRQYGNGSNSSVGVQLNTEFYKKKALVEVAKKAVFAPLASTTAMPKHFGKTIKQYHYLPILDDRNVTDQGIDASGNSTQMGVTIQVAWGANGKAKAGQLHGTTVKGEGANAAAALADAKVKAESVLKEMGLFDTDYATSKTAAEAAGWIVDESVAYPVSGNLYGSSKDVGTIADKLPTLTENGGRVNRVGFKRIDIEGSIAKFGFFDEYTEESLNFDTDAELDQHAHTAMLNAANEMNEDMIQMDLLNGAGVVMYAGDAISDSDISGEAGKATVVTYEDFVKLGIQLSKNRTPMQNTVIKGSRMVDTRVVSGGYTMFVGPDMIPTLRKLTDEMGERAFTEVKHYAGSGNTLEGEVGSIANFRIVVAQEMMYWAGKGATVVDNDGFHESTGNYDVHPLLVVGEDSFTTIGFNTDGKETKFTVVNKKPGSETADRVDPFGETGFMSIKWYYGSMILRPERLAVIKTAIRL